MISMAMLAMTAVPAAVAPLRGDFDHDGRPDVVRIEEGANGKFRLRISRGVDRLHPMTLLSGVGAPEFLEAAPKSGRFQTACGKGYYGFETGRCSRDWVRIRKGDLIFGYEGSSEAVALWNGKRFVVEWLSD